MSGRFSPLGLVREIRRRRLFRVGAVYAAAAFAVMEAADLMLPRLGLPDWTVTLVVVLAVLGFPLALVLSWVFDITPGGIRRTPAPETAPPASGKPPAVKREPLRRLGTAVLVLLLVLVGFWAGRVGTLDIPDHGSSPVDANKVAVLPFSFRGTEAFEYLEVGLVDLLSTKLDGAGPLRSIAPRAVQGIIRQEHAADGAVAEVARRLGAGLYVLGEVVEVRGRLHLSATLHRHPGDSVLTRAAVEGEAEHLFSLVDELAAALLSGRDLGPGARVTRTAAATTHSLEALKEYLQGEELFRAGHFGSALEAFREAIARDSSFALAHYRMSIAAEWAGELDMAIRAAEEAWRRSARLSDHDRRLLEAMLAWRRGDAHEAERLYRTIVGRWPDDVEAWFQLGEVLFHGGPIRGFSLVRSREAFQRVLFFEPEHVSSLWHLVRVAAVQHDLVALDTLLARVTALSPEGDRTLELVALQAFASGDIEAQQRVRDQVADAIDLTRILAVQNVAVYAEDFEGARELAWLLIGPSKSEEVRVTGHVVRAHMNVALGRPAAAGRELRAAAALDPGAGLEYTALLDLLPPAPPSTERLRELRAELEGWSPGPGRADAVSTLFFDIGTRVQPAVRSYLLGIVLARLGDPDAAIGYARELESGPTSQVALETTGDMARTVRAEVHLARGDTAGGVAQLEQVRMEVWYNLLNQSPFYSQAYGRYRRAQLLEATGRLREAARWYGSFSEGSLYDLAWHPVALLRRAAIHERLGDATAAARDYGRVLEIWTAAEPSMAPHVAHAREALRRVSAD